MASVILEFNKMKLFPWPKHGLQSIFVLSEPSTGNAWTLKNFYNNAKSEIQIPNESELLSSMFAHVRGLTPHPTGFLQSQFMTWSLPEQRIRRAESREPGSRAT
jgi:hypothetical protein